MTPFPNPSGRLIHFSRSTGKTKVLLDKLYFANGVALPPSEEFVVVAESHSSRMMKVWLKGAKKDESEVFFDGLPGGPDNLTFDVDGIWVPLAAAGDDVHVMVPNLLAGFPTVRKVTVRLMELLKMPFDLVHSFYPNKFTHFVCREFGSMDSILFILPSRKTVIRMDWNGTVLKTFHGSDKSLGVITHVMPFDGYLYLGSVISDYIGRVKIE